MKFKNLSMVWNRKKTTSEIEKNGKNNEPRKLRTIFKSLRYASNKDIFVLTLSIITAIINGLIGPINMYLFVAPVLSIFIESETPGNSLNMTAEVSKFHHAAYGIFVMAGLNSVFVIIQIMAGEIAARNIVTKIKTAYLSKMLSIEVSWYDESQEQFVSTVTHDLQKMAVLFDSSMASTVDIFSFFIVGFILSCTVSWKVALLNLLITLIGVIILYFIIQSSKKKGKSRQQYIKKCTKISSEVLGNARTVAAYCGEHKEIDRYNSTLKISNSYGLKHTIVLTTGKAFSYFLVCICFSVAYYFSPRLYLFGELVPGYLIVLLGGQINAIYYSTFLMSTISDLNMATDSAYRVMRFLDTETSYSKSIEEGIEPDFFKPHISFRNVQFSYPANLHTKVLQDLTLDIEPGKVTAVVGTSGSGKSTIVSLISRLYDVTSGGQILVGGVDIRKLNVSWLRNQIGVVGQEPMLFDTSIEENIRYGKTTATMDEIIEAAKASYAHGFIEKLPLGYDSIVGEGGIKLSGGQKQRIAIARAIVRKPKLLLLDEATSSLDVYSERIVQESLDNAMRDCTTLIIAHRMSTVKKADVIYAIKEGCVMEKGSHRKLMKLKGYYYSLVKIQELEEKDKALTLKQENVPGDELIQETTPIVEDNLEVPKKKKILSLKRKNLKVMAVWFVASLFTITTSMYLPTFYHIFSLFCESFTKTEDEMYWLALVDIGYLYGLGVLVFFSVVLSGVMSTIATQLWLEKLQKKAFSKLVSMDISWFDRSGNSPNACLEVLTNSPPLIESVTGERAAQVGIFFLSVLLCYAYSFFVNSNITVKTLPLFLIFIIINLGRIKSRDADIRSASLSTRSTKVATEYVQNIKTMQILNCQKFVVNQYQDMLERSKNEAVPSIAWHAVVSTLSKSFLRWTLGISIFYGASAVANGEVKGTILIGVVNSLSMASTLAVPALILMSKYPAARQAINQLHRIANTKTSLGILSDLRAKPEISGNIVFHDVVFSYPTRDKIQVFNKLNLKIKAGKTVALVGDSGCGKSTIISLLERFYFPNDGKILIDGNDINDINVRYLRSQMGLVSQEPFLFDATIKENIIYGLEEEVTMDKIIEAAEVANIHNFIMKLPQAYDTLAGERGSKLSGGQKQRIAIARAVLRNPKILLLDEATSALDTENEKVVQEALENALMGRTNIVVAHRLSTIRNADKIVVIQNGEVIEEGNHEQLMEKKGHYYSLLNR